MDEKTLQSPSNHPVIFRHSEQIQKRSFLSFPSLHHRTLMNGEVSIDSLNLQPLFVQGSIPCAPKYIAVNASQVAICTARTLIPMR